jgi:hypothetical protein
MGMFRHMAWSGGFIANCEAMNPSTEKCGYTAEAFSSWRLAGVAAQGVERGTEFTGRARTDL